MNTLNKAFIKAFARDRTKAARPKTDVPAAEAATGDVSDPSVTLIMHDLYEEGDRIRIDSRPAPETPVVPESHLVFGIVQHVESYDPLDHEAMAAEAVIVEDRTIGVVDDETEAPLTEDTRSADEGILQGEAKELVDVEIESDPVVEDSHEEREPEIETSWGYDVGNDRPDIGQGATIEFVDEEANDTTHMSVIVPEAVDRASDESIRALYGVEFGLPASTDLQDLKPGTFPVPVPGTPAVIPPAHEVSTPMEESEAAEASPSDSSSEDIATDEDLPPADSSLTNHMGLSTEVGEQEPAEPLEFDEPETEADEGESVPAYQPWPQLEPMTLGADSPETSDGKFGAAWEVDAFCWPEVCSQLDTAANGQLRESGAEIAAAAKQGLKVLAVTSVHREEGRTTLALSLARHAAAAGIRVALVDADAGNPELARQLGLEAPCSWHDVARQKQSLTEAAIFSLEDGVTLFPLAESTDGDLHAVDDNVLAQTLRALTHLFDLIVVDMYPIDVHPSPMFNACDACPVDMAVVVRDSRSTDQQQTVQAVQRIRKSGVKAVGIAENFGPT
jgi:Mrp family chromosome partitioning ATPase